MRISKTENRLLIIGFILLITSFFNYWPSYFWDLDVYQNAINIFNSGGSPYFELNGLRFVYAPYILILFSFLGAHLSFSLIIFYLSSVFLILREKLGNQLILYSLISTGIFYNDFLARSIATGNITIFLHFIIISSAFIRSRNHLIYFLLAISIAGFIKPYLFAYAFLGFFLWPKEKNYVKLLSITTLLIGCLFASQLLLAPGLFSNFKESLFLQAIGTMNGPGRDVGLAPYWIFGNLMNRWLALGLHFIVVIFLGIPYIKLGKAIDKFLNAEDALKILFFISLIFITFLNPRMKIYDYWIVIGSSTGIIFTLLHQTKLLSNERTLPLIIIIGLLFIFMPVIFKIYIPPIISYFSCLFYFKANTNRILKTPSFKSHN